MAITTTLTPPSRTQTEEAFSSTMDAFLGALPTWAGEVNATAAEMSGYAASASASAASATTDAGTASNAAASAAANANFRGEWASLTGALTVPAAVRHDGKNWQLLADLTDVTAAEPGVSAAWDEIKQLTNGNAGRVEISADYEITDDTPKKVAFVPTTSGLTVTIPESPEADGTAYVVMNDGAYSFALKSEAGYTIKTVTAGTGFVLFATGTATWAAFPLESLSFLLPGGQFAVGEASVFESAETNYGVVARLSDTSAIVAYCDAGNSSYGTACVLSVVDGEIVPGTPVVFESASTVAISVVALSEGTALVTYSDNGNSSYCTACALSISGTTITPGTAVVVDASYCSYPSMARISATSAILAYRGGSVGKACVLSVSGTSVSPGTVATWRASVTNYVAVALLSATSAIVAFVDNNVSNLGRAVVLTISGTTVTYGSLYTFEEGATSYISIAALTSNTALVTYSDNGNSSYCTACALSISGTTITPGTAVVVDAASAMNTAVVALSETKASVAYVGGSKAKANILFISGTGIAVGATADVTSGPASPVSLAGLTADELVVVYKDGAGSNYGKACLLEVV